MLQTQDPLNQALPETSAKPLCPVFGTCGGCAYQHLSYEAELALKENYLRSLFESAWPLPEHAFEPMVASPEPYHTRSRLDISFCRIRTGETFLGFMPANAHRILPVNACFLARREISDFLPELKRLAGEKLPPHYRNANLVVKCGDDGRVRWGGIGRRSLLLEPQDYFWTVLNQRKIFYSLETFFQANLSILPRLIRRIEDLSLLDHETVFWDLYAGVGLFGICFAGRVKKVVMIEESGPSSNLANFNVVFHGFSNVEICAGKVEDKLPEMLLQAGASKGAAMIDPPRKGLTPPAVHALARAKSLHGLLYLSCHPVSLLRDLDIFRRAGWQVLKVMPFDFFPRTEHVETLVLLRPGQGGG